jgi:hypothetical protein
MSDWYRFNIAVVSWRVLRVLHKWSLRAWIMQEKADKEVREILNVQHVCVLFPGSYTVNQGSSVYVPYASTTLFSPTPVLRWNERREE